MVSCSISLLYFPLAFDGGRQGSVPYSLEVWGDFLYVHLSVRSPLWAIQPCLMLSQPVLRPSQPSLKPEAGWLAKFQAWLAGPQAWLDGPEGGHTDRWTDVRTVPLPSSLLA